MKNTLCFVLLLSWLLWQTPILHAQNSTNASSPCSTNELMEARFKQQPELRGLAQQRDRIIRQYLDQQTGQRSNDGSTRIIPVVVYVVHNNGPENISDQQIYSQINVLNTQFENYGLQFCLATEEDGVPLPGTGSDPGIIRIQSALTNSSTSPAGVTALTNLSDLPPERYLRIFVVNGFTNVPSVLGYAIIPEGPIISQDAVVMRYVAFGDAATCGCSNLLPGHDEGETLTHEVGHYLGLYHVFHGGCSGMTAANCETEGDLVCDTPPAEAPHYSCSTSDNSCNESPNLPDLLNNYMEYVDDQCKTSFTQGQCDRMHAVITNFRSTLVSNDNHIYTGITCGPSIFAEFSPSSFLACSGGAAVTFTATSVPGATFSWDFGDGSTANGMTVNHVFTTVGVSTITLTVSDGTNLVSTSQLITVETCAPILGTESHWFFPDQCGLEFSTGIPVFDPAADINNTISGAGNETAATQSDANGNLLFYSDGRFVWDYNHQLLPVSLGIGSSSSMGTIFVPHPSLPDEYFLFHTRNNGSAFTYRTVSTAGGVISVSNPSTLMPAPPGFVSTNGALVSGESVTAVAGCNGEYWILTQGRMSNTDRFLVVYRLDNNGNISINSTFAIPELATQYISLEAAPNGRHIAMGTFSTGSSGAYLIDFNPFTGMLSDLVLLPIENSYSVSFSPNSQLLYILQETTGDVFQYQVLAQNPVASGINIGNIPSNVLRRCGMQRGPDNKIYITRRSENQLSVIQQPNEVATLANPNACMLSSNGPILGRPAASGLPNMLDANTQTVATNTISTFLENCDTYSFLADVCTDTYNWNFGDPGSGANNTSTLASPSHTFTAPGTYTVTLTTTITSFTISVVVGNGPNAPNIAGPDCNTPGEISNYSVSPGLGFLYEWTVSSGEISGANNTSSVDLEWTSLPGTITLTITDPATGCTASSSRTISQNCDDPGGNECTAWPKAYGTEEGNEWGIDVRTDSEGNVYALGRSNAEGVSNMESLPDNFETPYFLARYDFEGCIEWIVGIEEATQLEIDGESNLIVANGGGSTLGNIFKYNSNGNLIWTIDVERQNNFRIAVEHASGNIAAVFTDGKYLGIRTPYSNYEIYPSELEDVSALVTFKSDGSLIWSALNFKIKLRDVFYTPHDYIYTLGFSRTGSGVVYENADGTTGGETGCNEGGPFCMNLAKYKTSGDYNLSYSELLSQETPLIGRIEYWYEKKVVYASSNGPLIYAYDEILDPEFVVEAGKFVNLLNFHQKEYYLLAEDKSFDDTNRLLKYHYSLELIWEKNIKYKNYGTMASAAVFKNYIFLSGRYSGKAVLINSEVGGSDITISQIGGEDLYITRLRDNEEIAIFEGEDLLAPPSSGFSIPGSNQDVQGQVYVYPNPTQAILNIVSESGLESYAIFDLNGRLLMNQRLSGEQLHTIDLSSLNKGIYLIKLFTPEGTFVEKVVRM